MSWREILNDLKVARLRFDRLVEQQSSTARENRIGIYCAPGCSNCCSLAVNCSFTEALATAQALNSDQQQALKIKIPILQQISLEAENLKAFLQLFREKIGGCPWLQSEDGHCDIYQLRPFSCRALLSTRNSSWCGIDFSSLHPQEKEAFLSSLDPEIVTFPTHYLAASQELGLEFELQALSNMRAAFAVSLTGNLLYLSWLELEHQLSKVIPAGFTATQEFLTERQLDLPFLLQLQGQDHP